LQSGKLAAEMETPRKDTWNIWPLCVVDRGQLLEQIIQRSRADAGSELPNIGFHPRFGGLGRSSPAPLP
jgi:hypothetical protein